MTNKKWYGGVISMLLFAIIAYGQQTNTTWMEGLHPCTGDSVAVHESMSYEPDGERITLTVLGMSKTWSGLHAYMSMYSEKDDFILGAISMAGIQCGGGGVASLPAIAASATFQQAIFTHQAVPRIISQNAATVNKRESQSLPATSSAVNASESSPVENQSFAGGSELPDVTDETESGNAVQLEVVKPEDADAKKNQLILPPNNVTTDVEWSHFKQNKEGGNSFALRAAYNRKLSNEKVTLGGTLIVNTMVMMEKVFFNNALNLGGTIRIKETVSLERKIGAGANMFLVNKDFYGTPFGMSVVVNFSDNHYLKKDKILTYGAMLQQSFVGDMKTLMLTAGVLYGVPIGERFAINTSAVYAINILTMGSDGVVDLKNRNMIQPAINLSTYLTKAFSLDAGVKTTFLVKDYNDFILTIGGTVLF
jgi:hypothetical protein